MVPYWKAPGAGPAGGGSEEYGLRPVALALVDSDLRDEAAVTVDVRGKRARAMVVSCHLRNRTPPVAQPVIW